MFICLSVYWRRFYLMIFRKWDRIFCSDTYVNKFGDTFSNTFIHKNYLRWEFKSGKSRIWRILSVLIVGSYKKDNSVLPYGTKPALKTRKILLYLHSYLLVKRPDSSVGRATDWKSVCRWFNSTSGYRKIVNNINS